MNRRGVDVFSGIFDTISMNMNSMHAFDFNIGMLRGMIPMDTLGPGLI